MDLESAFQNNGIIKKGHFPLRSGKHSDTYVCKDLLFCYPLLFGRVIRGMYSLILKNGLISSYDLITGPPMSGAMMASCLAFHSRDGSIFPEKIDGSIVFRRGFDRILPGKKVLLIEDVTTTGGSVQRTVRAVQKHGGEVPAVIVLWNRGNVKSEEYPIYSLIDREIPSWEPKNCPLCKEGLPLYNPKEQDLNMCSNKRR